MRSNILKAIITGSCLALLPVAANAKKSSKEEAQVQCKDGTTSKAGRGACSHHGGVAGPVTGSEDSKASAKTASQSAKEAAEVQCKDGTTSKAGRGACSHHGGIAAASAADTNTRQESRSAPDTQPEAKSAPQGRAPATSQRAAPAGKPTARCKDGTLSYSQHRSGTCSRHGGVAEWLAQ
jgi:hypothetical protein